MTRTVLICTDGEDRTASRVTAELAVRGVPVARVDATDFPTSQHVRRDHHGQRVVGDTD